MAVSCYLADLELRPRLSALPTLEPLPPEPAHWPEWLYFEKRSKQKIKFMKMRLFVLFCSVDCCLWNDANTEEASICWMSEIHPDGHWITSEQFFWICFQVYVCLSVYVNACAHSRGLSSPGAGFTDSYNLPDTGIGTRTQVLCKSSTLLTTELFLQPTYKKHV